MRWFLLPLLLVLLAPTAAAAPGGYGWPLQPRPHVARAFDKPEHNWLPGHRGVDLAGRPGQQVLAAGDGTVVFVGAVGGKDVVSISHAGGLRTTYEPVSAHVRKGQRVFRGDVVGVLEAGHPGCDGCLHWGVLRDRDYLNPLGLVHALPIRLKPVNPTAR
ncbi:M23 family metallopeptidase [Skermania sp. ID1734]|uniref:M23 family metallopeptidase n=1 Tax=Skermania sp. ID1734 TaxID=2597516 RepID=UPI00351ABB72